MFVPGETQFRHGSRPRFNLAAAGRASNEKGGLNFNTVDIRGARSGFIPPPFPVRSFVSSRGTDSPDRARLESRRGGSARKSPRLPLELMPLRTRGKRGYFETLPASVPPQGARDRAIHSRRRTRLLGGKREFLAEESYRGTTNSERERESSLFDFNRTR